MSNSLKYAGLGASVSSAPYDDDAWVSPISIYADDGVYANITAATFDASAGDYSTILKATTFGFAIPGVVIPTSPQGIYITGLKVEIEKYHANGDVVDAVVQFTLDGTARVGDNKADTVTHWEAAPTIVSYGGENDKWGREWAAAEINAATFGVHFVAAAHGEDADAFVDYIRVTVYYQEIADIPAGVMPVRRSRFKMTSRGDVAAQPEWIIGIPAPGLTVPAVPTVAKSTVVAPFTDTGAITMSIATPCVVSRVGHGLAANREIYFKTSGALPTGLVQFTHYYVKSPAADTFNVSATPGGAAINTSGSQSGTHNLWTKDP